ncbi:MAG TPA: tautomerase family protein [Hyphomonas sp.]|nr:tautomerase family protein [Hyphomonas sp.]
MPHIIVKLWPGNAAAQKAELTQAILRDVVTILGTGEDSVSIGFEEVPAGDWNDRVFEPDILDKWDTLAKEPGYGMRPDKTRR